MLSKRARKGAERTCIFKTMAFVTKHQTDRCVAKYICQCTKRLVRDDEHYDASTSELCILKQDTHQVESHFVPLLAPIAGLSSQVRPYHLSHPQPNSPELQHLTISLRKGELKLRNRNSDKSGLLSSFAQFRTRLLGQTMMHLSIVGFPLCGDCLRRVYISEIH